MLSIVLYSVKGGIETYTLQLANALASIARVAYAVDRQKKEQIANYVNPEVTLIEFDRPRLREIWGIFTIYDLSKKIKKFKPDIFHLQGDGVWESILLRFLKDIPIINTVHDPIKHIDQRTYLNNWTMKDAVNHSKGWVVHGRCLKEILIEKNQVNKDLILVHPHGVYDFYLDFASRSQDKENYILFFGELRINKGLSLLLEAFDQIKDEIPGWKVVIAGQGDISKLDYIEKNKNRVDIIDRYIDDAETAELFSKAGVVVLPYRHGSQSGVLALAAAFYSPVVVTEFGNIPEIINNRKHALLIKTENIEQLADALREIIKNDDLRSMLGYNLGELGRLDWAWEKIATKTLNFYMECISKDSYGCST